MVDTGLPLETDRLRLRRLQRGDLDAFAAYRGDADLGRYQGWTPMSRGEAAAFIEEMHTAPAFVVGEWLQLAIAARDGDGLLGDVGIVLHDATTAEIGFTLARQAQGRGFGSEAVAAVLALLFDHTAVLRVQGVTDARNATSARLLARLGLRRVASADVLFRGEPCTEWTYEMQRVDWRALNAGSAGSR